MKRFCHQIVRIVFIFILSLLMIRAWHRALSFHRNPRLSFRMFSSSSSLPSDAAYLAVHVRGKVSNPNDFYLKTLENAKNSVLESGIARFDVLRDVEHQDDFLLMEVYSTAQGPDEHKQTQHYNAWRDGVAPLMAVPRAASKYRTIFPSADPSYWKTDASASRIDIDRYSVSLPWNYTLQASESSYHANGLFVVLVDVHVVSGSEEQFMQATLKNCKESIKEGGIHRFDLLQNIENPSNFVLVEAYNSPLAPASHKATAHYKAWAAEVAAMMAQPRTAKKYASLYPLRLYWHQSGRMIMPGENGRKGLSSVAGQAFSFLGPKISFGRNIAAKAITTAIKDLKISKPMIICGKSGLQRYSALFANSLVQLAGETSYSVAGEPTVEDVLAATAIAKTAGCDGVLAVGGGSAIDLGKVVAAMVTNDGDIYDYIEVIGKGQAIQKLPVPLIAVPTTSGTGSEATKNAVLKSIKFQRKASVRHDSMIADIAIIDPMLTLTCPPDVTAHVGLDTLCQVIEPYVSNAANPIVDAIAKEGILRAARSLRDVVADGSNIEAREDLAIASLMGGISLANAKLGAVHGFAGVLGGMYDDAPHGAICAALLPHVFQKNCERLSAITASISPESEPSTQQLDAKIRLQRFEEVSRMITGNAAASYMDGVAWLYALVRDLQVPPLSQLCRGMKVEDVDSIVQNTAAASSTKGNPIVLSNEDLRDILTTAF
jgi:alcohol dehydrogenase class IV/quinol monooxygenase YgiN